MTKITNPQELRELIANHYKIRTLIAYQYTQAPR